MPAGEANESLASPAAASLGTFLCSNHRNFDNMRQQYGGPKLPADLRTQLGGM
jgi:hypothetical protein